MSETPLMNNEAARSPTGEILDQAPAPTAAETAAAARAAESITPTTPTTPDPAKSSEAISSTTSSSTEPKPAEGAPEAYADFKAPENYTLDPKMIAEAAPIFKELGLSQDQAQRLVDLQAKLSLAAAKAPQETYEKLRSDWRTEANAHPDLKGKLGPGGEVSTVIGKAIDSFGPDLAKDFRAAMDLTGAGDNPAFIRAFYKLAQSVAEGTHVSGTNPSPHSQAAPGAGKPSAAKSMYPNLA